MYTNETTHFGIPLPLGSDLTTPMDYNEAAEAIDTALFEAQGDAATANENAAAAVETANATSEALGTLSTTVGGHTSQIAALAARMTGAENDITDVRSDLEDMITAYNEPTATSTHAYSAGDYFIYNDVLYKANDTIAIGATIVPNTNCEATNVATEVTEVKSALTDKVSGIDTTNAPTSLTNTESGGINYTATEDSWVFGCVCSYYGYAPLIQVNGKDVIKLTQTVGSGDPKQCGYCTIPLKTGDILTMNQSNSYSSTLYVYPMR